MRLCPALKNGMPIHARQSPCGPPESLAARHSAGCGHRRPGQNGLVKMEDEDFGDLIANAVIAKYHELPKGGKPNDTEWTILAGIVAIEKPRDGFRDVRQAVLCVATGTKCLGPSKMCHKGQVLNDSHGEVLARRAFIRAAHWHLEQMALTAGQGVESRTAQELFEWSETTTEARGHPIRLRHQISLHLYVSQAPCGDASIFKLSEPDGSRQIDSEKQCSELSAHPSNPKRMRVSTDDHRIVEIVDMEQRTGAKPLASAGSAGEGKGDLGDCKGECPSARTVVSDVQVCCLFAICAQRKEGREGRKEGGREEERERE
jgi:hypothetical protein